MSNQERRLLHDATLSTDARVLGLYICTRGAGAQEIERADMELVLSPEAGKKRVQKALGQLERRGWLQRTPGGRGRHDLFEFVVPGTQEAGDRGAPEAQLSDRGAPEAQLNGPQTDYRVPPGEQLNDRGSRGEQLNGLRGAPEAQLNEPTQARATRARVVVDVGDVDDTTPSTVSPRPSDELHAEAGQVIEEQADTLKGCRGALRDYVAARIRGAARQKAYVYGVASILNGAASEWHDGTGSAMPPPERPAFMATMLNELLADGEVEMKGKPGDIRNLRTKISVNLRNRGRYGGRSNEAQSGGGGAARGGRGQKRPAAPGGGSSKAGRRRVQHPD